MNRTLDRISDRLFTRENTWSGLSLLAAIAGAVATRTVLKTGWRKTTGREAPQNPAADDSTWMETIVWALMSGAIVGVVRSVSRRGVTSVRHRWS